MSTKTQPTFNPVDTRVSFPALEEGILAFWRENDTFRKSIALRAGGPNFSFYEGPPTANGRPGTHHILARVFKDLFPRYKTMQGYQVPRIAGWDCHGLPVEIEVEKQIGSRNKSDIEAYGVERFIEKCRASVLTYVEEFDRLTERIGYWCDLEHPYWTMDTDYIESVWNLLRRFWDDGMLYQGYKIVPYCARCGTPLSTHEVAQGYKEITDQSAYVRVRLNDAVTFGGPTNLLIWTTAPWTLPANVAVAASPNLPYVLVRQAEEQFILAETLLDSVLGAGTYEVIRAVAPDELIGQTYRPIFAYFTPDKPAWRVVAGDFVTADDGTGLVHITPPFGQDDFNVGMANDLPIFQPVDLTGHFTAEVTDFAGLAVKPRDAKQDAPADPAIIRHLKESGALYRVQPYRHQYPHCWRCDTPLIYYALSTWFIAMSRERGELLRTNDEINWVPEHYKEGRFGTWLANVNDWALSRNRYWGTPLPVWISETTGGAHCIGSLAELRELALDPLPDDLHRPYIDTVRIRSPHDGSVMRRVPEVIDTWFDSGSMPFAQFHYPFEHAAEFKRDFPADYICEAVDQTRGWFYSLHAIATALEHSPAYKNVICLGHILGPDGSKMSKSRGNVVDPWELMETHGADATRWYFFTAAPPGNPRRFSMDLVRETVAKFMLTLWNSYSFFVTYARLDGWTPATPALPVSERPELDRWVLSELHQLIETVTAGMEAYDVTTSGRAIERFVDDLSNWYIRRSRRRFWKTESDADKNAAYATLYECLVTVAHLLAPFTPFLAEAMYQNLVRRVEPDAADSVHLRDWPAANVALIDRELSRDVRAVVQTVSLGRAARMKATLKVRQPLARLLIHARDADEQEALMRLADQLKEELNVKAVEPLAAGEDVVSYRVRPNLPALGPKYGKQLGGIRAALAALDPNDVARRVAAGGSVPVTAAIALEPDELLVDAVEREGYAVIEEGGYTVALDIALTPELVREGMARDLVRAIQDARKAAGLNIADTIALWVAMDTENEDDTETRTMLDEYAGYVSDETLATRFTIAPVPDGAATAAVTLGGVSLVIGLEKSGTLAGGSARPVSEEEE
jgi:isoleucyl-tRNA synthetase